MRTYRAMFNDNLSGLFHHSGDALINKRPITDRIVAPSKAEQRAAGRRAVSVRLGKSFIEKLKGLGIK